MPKAPFTFSLADMEQYADEHAGSADQGGYVCQVRLDQGWVPNPYPRGVSQEDRFVNMDEYGEKAKAIAEESGVGTDRQPAKAKFHLQLALYGNTVLNRETPKWGATENRRLYQVQVWEWGYKDILRPSLERVEKEGFLGGDKEWVHVRFEFNQRLKDEKDKEEYVPVILEYFPTEEAAREYAENLSAEDLPFDLPPQPEEWSAEVAGPWRNQILKTVAALEEDPDAEVTPWPAGGFTEEVIEYIKKNIVVPF